MTEETINGQALLLPSLSVKDGAAAVAFYKDAFDAVELMCITSDNGEVVAELSVNGARFIVADEAPAFGNFSPETLGGSTIRMGLQVADPDSFVAKAKAAGAIEIYPVADQDYGYRLGRIADPFGHHWEIFRPLK